MMSPMNLNPSKFITKIPESSEKRLFLHANNEDFSEIADPEFYKNKSFKTNPFRN